MKITSNGPMRSLLDAHDISHLSWEDVPEPLRGVLTEGWLVDAGQASVLKTLWEGYHGDTETFTDLTGMEGTINSVAITDWDLPRPEADRIGPLIRRAFAYADQALLRYPSSGAEGSSFALVSLSKADTADALWTASVTFWSPHPGEAPLVDNVEGGQDQPVALVTAEPSMTGA